MTRRALYVEIANGVAEAESGDAVLGRFLRCQRQRQADTIACLLRLCCFWRFDEFNEECV